MNFGRHPRICFAAEGEGAGSGAAPPEVPVAGADQGADHVEGDGGKPTETATEHKEAGKAAEPEKTGGEKTASEETKSGSLLSDAEGKDKKSPEPKEAGKTENEPDKGKDGKSEPEKGKVEPDKKAADAEEPPPPEPLKYEPFTLPEGVKLDGDRLKEAETILGGAQVPQAEAQKLIDLYIKETQAFQVEAQRHQQTVWNEQINKWKDEFRKDPDLGGNREQTTLSTAKAVIEEFGGSKEQQTALFEQLNHSGMGNNVSFIRLLFNIGAKLGVHEDNIVPSPTSGRTGRNFGEGWYDKGKAASA